MQVNRLLPMAMFGVASFFYLYEFLLRVTPSAMYAELMRAYDIDATNFGLLTSAYFFSYGLLQLPVGAWMDRLGPRRLLTFAIVLCAGATMLSAVTHSFFLACVARFIIGAGSAFAFISCMKIVTLWFEPKHFSLLAGLTLTIGTLGAVAGQVPVSLAMHWMDWRSLLLVIGWIGLMLAILAWVLIKDKNTATQTLQSVSLDNRPQLGFWHCLRQIARRKQNWLVAVYGLLVTGPTDALGGSWGIAFLQQGHGFDRDVAASCTSLTFVGLAIGSLFFSWITTVMGSRRQPMWIAALCATITLSLLIFLPTLHVWSASVLYFSFGFFSTYVLSFVVIRDINEPHYVGTAVGFVNMASILGSTLLISGAGVLLDYALRHSHPELLVYALADYRFALAVLPLCYFLCVICIIPLMKESYPKAQQSIKI